MFTTSHGILTLAFSLMVAVSGVVMAERPCCCDKDTAAKKSHCCSAETSRHCGQCDAERPCKCNGTCGCKAAPSWPLDRTTNPCERFDDIASAPYSLPTWSFPAGIANFDLLNLMPGREYSTHPPARILFCTWLK